MKLVDTHCHLDFPDYKKDLDEVISRALSEGVERMIVPGTNLESSKKAVELAEKYPQIYAAVGIHPHEADKVTPEEVEELKGIALKEEKVVAIGEIGLDYYRNFSKKENQKKLFTSLIEFARRHDFPVIVHSREAEEDVLEILKSKEEFNFLRGTLHCFSGDESFLKEILAMNFYLSFAGNITFPKADSLKDLVKKVPVERLLLETDSPYITPQEHRGRRNEPSYLKYLIDVYSSIYQMPKEEVARITSRNADTLFRLGLEKKDTVSYKIRDSLYLNITYRCTNRCNFCTRDVSDYVKGYDLKLDREPTYEEIIEAIGDPKRFSEVVFCGFGEPTLRLEMIKKVASYVKEKGGKVRVTTNGEGDLINARSIAPELKGLIDRVSVSLNAPDEDVYGHICRSVYGKEAFGDILKFITSCVKEGIQVEVTCLDIVGEDGVERCKRLAEEHGATFRLRHLNAVG